VDRIEQQKIKEAKELLERYAPKGEFLAYINEKEAGLLEAYGGAGKPIKETNIPSFFEPFTMFAIAMAASTAVTFMGSLHQAQNLKRAAKWDKRRREVQAKQYSILAKQKAAVLFSEKRARIAARGLVGGTGSTLMEQQTVLDQYNDAEFWAAKGLAYDLQQIGMESDMAIRREYFRAGENLLRGIGQTYQAYSSRPK